MRGREKPNERALDRRLAGRRSDLRSKKISDVKHVDGALAERGNVRRGNVEIELRQRGGQLEQQTGPVESRHLHHGVTARPAVVDGERRLQRKGPQAPLAGGALRKHFRQPQVSA